MNSKELERSYLEKKDIFHKFINNIKKNSPWDIYTIGYLGTFGKNATKKFKDSLSFISQVPF